MELVHLRTSRTSVILDVSGGVPAIVHWGAALDGSGRGVLERVVARPRTWGTLDHEAPLSLVPEHGSGFPGRPGLTGRRADGSAWAPRFAPSAVEAAERRVQVTARDVQAGLALTIRLELDDDTDVLSIRVDLLNEGVGRYELDGLWVSLPVPAEASELLTFTGRWAGEFRSVRRPFLPGAYVAENRRGRTSHDHVPAIFAGTPGFAQTAGEVWAAQLAWSGNHIVAAERMSDGRRYLQLGELLHPGEVVLDPGEVYESPWLHAVHSRDGLNGISDAFHRHVRHHGAVARADRPRPVLLNTWEAVYFDHDAGRLRLLAERAAEAGVERFVLDDGWFLGRRHDRAGLGDWFVDPAVHPDGLGPLIDHVRALGMEFGLWVEPEMVNPDSDLFRAHPDWVLAVPGYEPVVGRNQLVLDLVRPEAFAYVLGRLDDLLTHHAIGYLKWDMNRDLTQAEHAGRAGTHAQTKAVYALVDELRRRHPQVEIESCASGGGRADLGILRRACRIWTSDCNDALDRVEMQWNAGHLFPPEVLGAHIGPPTSHTTGRRHRLGFRALVALFGHLGIEWNLLDASDQERRRLAELVALHKRFRPVLHAGRVVRLDHPDPAIRAWGVVGDVDALFAAVQIATSADSVPAPVRLGGLEPEARYRVQPVALPGEPPGLGREPLAWMATPALEVPGQVLHAVGLPLPPLLPESGLLIHLTRVQ